MNLNFKKIISIVYPQLEVGGLEITDSYLRFVILKGREARAVSSQLPPGVVEEGKVKDKSQFIEILKSFHGKIVAEEKEKICVVLSIPDNNFYTEIFSVPKSVAGNLEESARLNMQMISPIDFDQAYSSWQLLGEKNAGDSAIFELLGAFIQKQTVDDYEYCLKNAGFEIVAVESLSLALSRVVVDLGEGISRDKNYLFLRLGSDGVSFGLIKGGGLYFLRSVSWTSAYGDQRKISFELLKKLLVEEIQKVLSFCETRSESSIENLILVTPVFADEIPKLISESFPFLKVVVPHLREHQDMTLGWFSVLGSALRGAISRSKDKFINLAATGTGEQFENHRTLNFVNLWKNVIFSVLGGILILFLVLDVSLARGLSQLKNSSGLYLKVSNTSNLTELQNGVNDFNKKVNLIYSAYKGKKSWASFFSKLEGAVGNDIVVKRLWVQSASSPIILYGEATSDTAIIGFKNRLESDPYFSNVNFQLSSIIPSAGKFNFNISFNVKDL